MVEVDEFDLTATARVEHREPVARARRRPTELAWTWVGIAVALVLVALLVTPRSLPPMTHGVLQGDLSRAPTEVWATPLPAWLVDDIALREGDPVFTGEVQATTGEPRVVVASGLVGVAGFDAGSGELLWQHEISGAFCQVTTAVVCVHAAGKWQASLSVIDAVSGERTIVEAPGAMHAIALTDADDALTIAVAGTVAVLGADGSGTWVTLLDPDGSERWRTHIADRVGAESLLSVGDRIYLAGVAPSVVDVTTGLVVAHPARVRPGPEGTVEIYDGSGALTLVLPDGDRLSPGKDVAEARVSQGDGTRLPGAEWPVLLIGDGGATTAVDVQTDETLWVAPSLMSAGAVLGGDLVGVVDDGVLVRWSW